MLDLVWKSTAYFRAEGQVPFLDAMPSPGSPHKRGNVSFLCVLNEIGHAVSFTGAGRWISPFLTELPVCVLPQAAWASIFSSHRLETNPKMSND